MPSDHEQSAMPPSFYDAIERLRKNSPMYLGNRSLQNFAHWLNGYSMALHDMGIPISEEQREFSDFHAFVAKRMRMASNAHWSKNILYYYEDDGSALEQFFILFDEFCKKKRRQKARKPHLSKSTREAQEKEGFAKFVTE